MIKGSHWCIIKFIWPYAWWYLCISTFTCWLWWIHKLTSVSLAAFLQSHPVCKWSDSQLHPRTPPRLYDEGPLQCPTQRFFSLSPPLVWSVQSAGVHAAALRSRWSSPQTTMTEPLFISLQTHTYTPIVYFDVASTYVFKAVRVNGECFVPPGQRYNLS